MVRDLHGAPGRAGLSTGLWRAWGRADTIGEADRGGGHPQAEQGRGRFRRWAGAVCAAPKVGPRSGVRGGVPAIYNHFHLPKVGRYNMMVTVPKSWIDVEQDHHAYP